jgi:hypothetical protein
MDRAGAPKNTWFLAHDYLAHIHSLCAHCRLNWKVSEQVSRGGIPDISHLLMFYWFQPVLYLDLVSKFPETTEKLGYFVGFADNVGDVMTFKILKNGLNTVLYRSVGRFAADANHRNKRVSFKSEVQDSLIKLDIKTSADFRNSQSKDKSRAFNDNVSTRTRSKTDFGHLDHGVAVRTRSKPQNKCNLSVQGIFFPLHDVVYFKGHEFSMMKNCN